MFEVRIHVEFLVIPLVGKAIYRIVHYRNQRNFFQQWCLTRL